jgi:hypothetical protein
MKLRLNKLTASLVMAGSVAAVVGCGGGGTPTLDVATPRAEVVTAAYKYSFVFVDANTLAPITDDLTVTFLGDAVAGDEVVDQSNVSVKGKTFTAKNGVLLAAANFDKTPANNVFTVVAGNRTAGWNESGLQLSKDTSVVGDQVVTIKLTNTKPAAVTALNANSDLGMAMKVNTLPAAAGGVIAATSASVATAPKNAITAEGTTEPVGVASVTFPAGVKATNAAGTAINTSGGVTVSVTKYSNNEAASLSAFPGGFTPSVTAPASAIGAGATADTGAFISGGFAQFNVTDNATGQALKTFDAPLTLKIDLPKGSKNLDGVDIVAGNTYPIWSYNQDTGKWEFEVDGVVKEKSPVDPKNFEVEFTSTHLSYWNLDFYGRTCTGNVAITGRPAGDTRPLTVELVGVAGQRFSRTGTIRDSQLGLARYPVGTRVNVTVRDSKNRVVGSRTGLDLCATGQSVAVNLPTVVLAPLTVNLTESCRDGTSGVRTTPASVWFYDNTTRNWLSGYGANGTVTLNGLENASTGTLYVYNRFTNNYIVTNNLAVNAPSTVRNVNLPNLACTTGGQPITGGQPL